MTKILVLFNLQTGTSIEEYEGWAKSFELAKVNGLKSVDNFEIYKTTGLMFSDDQPPYAYFEILDIPNMDKFGKEVDSDVMHSTVEAFQRLTDNAIFITSNKL